MADLSTGINEALQEGYSPDEVLSHLQKNYPNIAGKLKEAIKEGYKPKEILDHLSKQAPVAQPDQNDTGVSQERTQLGLPTLDNKGQRITSIRPSERLLSQGQQPAQQPANFAGIPGLPIGLPQAHPLITRKGFTGGLEAFASDPIGLGHMIQSAGEIGQKAGSGQPYGLQAAGLGGQMALATTPGAKLATGALGLATFSGIKNLGLSEVARFAGEAGREAMNIPILRTVGQKVSDSFASLVAQTPLLEHEIMNRTATHLAEMDQAVQEAGEFGKEMRGYNFDKESLAKIYDSYVGKKEADLLPNEREFLDKIIPVKEQYTKLAVAENLTTESYERYFTQMYEGKSKQYLRPIMEKMPQSFKRTFESFFDLEKTQQKMTDELTAKGVTKEEFLKMSDKEVKSLGFSPKDKGVLALAPIKDPIKAVQAQILGTRMALSTKKLMVGATDLVDQNGAHLLEYKPSPGYVKLPDHYNNVFQKYVAKATSGRAVYFKELPVYVQGKFANSVKQLLDINQTHPNWLKGLNEFNSIAKQGMFFNPMFHDINLISNSLQVFGMDIKRVLGIPGKRIASDSARMDEAIQDGFNPQHIFTLKKQLAEDFGMAMNRYKIPGLSSVRDIMQKVNDKMLWSYANNIGLTVWDATKAKLIKQGIPSKEAGFAAVAMAHDVIGKMTKLNTMSAFKNPYVNAFVNFIPSWVNSSVRKYVGAFMPQQAFKHLSPLAQKALQTEYQQNLIRGVTIGLFSSNRLNMAFSGHSVFENSPQNMPSMTRPFGRIEIPIGNKIYAVDYPGFSSLTLPARLISAVYNLAQGHPAGALGQLQPLTRTALTQGMNMQMNGKPIVPQGTPLGQQIGPRVKSALQTNNPMGVGNLMNLRDQHAGIKEQAWEYILPLRVTQQDPAKDPILKMWRMYDTDKHYEVIALYEKWYDDLDSAIEKGNIPEATKIATLHGMKAPAFGLETIKFTKPVTYSFMKVPQNVRNKYFARLEPNEQQRLLDKIKMEATQQGNTP